MAAVGLSAEVVPWGDGVDWGAYEGVVVRGTWDYIEARDEFLDWAASVAAVTRLANPFEVLRWNTDKSYLRDLEAAGIPIVPTTWGSQGPFPEGEFVVKPAVSAGARNSARHTSAASGAAHAAAIEADGGVAMVQPFLASVESEGETGTYVFGGQVSHAIRKMGILDPGASPADVPSMSSVDRVSSVPVDPALAEFALRVLAASEFAEPVLYARVDTVPGLDGRPLVIELELTEPYLFLADQPAAAAPFAATTAAWLAAP
ncbi:MAG: hypothetical protein QOI20_3144 [Acidimicrobiaceae bacterium]|nr:hypothetical protein [Acidimicrobiaceae bacterium]